MNALFLLQARQILSADAKLDQQSWRSVIGALHLDFWILDSIAHAWIRALSLNGPVAIVFGLAFLKRHRGPGLGSPTGYGR